MTTIKLDSKLNGPVQVALHSLTEKLYRTPGMRIVGLVELAHVARTQIPDGEEKDSTVTLGIKLMEIGIGDHEHPLRRAMDALYRHRTAEGTIDETLMPVVDERVVDQLGDTLDGAQAHRLGVAVKRWEQHVGDLLRREKTPSQWIAEIGKLRMAMRDVLAHNESSEA